MSKIIVIPEPHISYKNIAGRNNYVDEIKSYMNKIYAHILSDTKINYSVFVGDIFNRGFRDVDEYFYWIDWFKMLLDLMLSRGGCIYSAIGNHELSYSKSNPFWRLISMDDGGYNTNIMWRDKSAKPCGFNSIIRVEDVVELDNNCSLFFCHYDRISEFAKIVDENIDEYGDSKIRICISHNSIISNEIVNSLKINHNRDPLSDYIKYERIDSLDLFHKFEYVFNGHMHRAFSQYTITDDNGHNTKLLYLGSLGRTNSDEIDDSDLKRVCPMFDTDTKEMTLFGIRLLNRSESLEHGYDIEKNERLIQKREYSEVCRKIVDVNDPIKELMLALDDRDMLVALECAISDSEPQRMIELVDRYKELSIIGNGAR